ncbi:bifunctional phosphopantothenoylcysteine decarboxylase/phosphopantothenate--cysteine ligase CoaBC [Weissella confusa]|uniref:Coenzyme A biosynthesis bifunctional protein CoaBC n=1 Tax=Weissella confusa TaxID=1583 RepID=A0AAJ3DAD0_WEICO|nr:bifunctional phosphopantothenoylcysteine decarboxylase/phosphopantothenate--cysteine ligase CoaBC [Weissella confusa]NBA10889.1 bifunctional phosphopantothenoylcysteine decarboxylase/phosphopantothenate--cysteine ligase CoaBC [Weissella confusa]
MFTDKNIVLIVSGGVAAYKSAIFARLLMKQGANVKVVMTQAATEFVTPKTFEALTQHPVVTDLFDDHNESMIAHVSLADWADYIFVVPATANILAKMAAGIGDDAATSVLLARHTPVIVAPAMNVNMYENPATQRNLETLREDGVIIIEPAEGMLAEGYAGKGRLPEPDEILALADLKLRQQTGRLAGKKVVVSAGGTVEPIDPVRFITNRSSGKMGYALAQAAAEQGADVTLVSSSELPAPVGVAMVPVQSARDLLAAMMERFEDTDVAIMAAAVSDYRVATPADQKMKKNADHAGLTIDLVENPDILATLGQQKTTQYLVGFAAETQDLLTYAQNKLEKKNADMLVANDVSKAQVGFGHDTNEVTLLQRDAAPEKLPLQSKLALARDIMSRIATQVEGK